MTLSKKHVEGVHFAYLPHECDKCHRIFWLEHYTMCSEYVGFTKTEMTFCSECRSIENKEKMDGGMNV